MFKETVTKSSSQTLKEYYNYTKDSMKNIQELTFGGLCNNYGIFTFPSSPNLIIEDDKICKDAISLYEDRKIWDSCLQKGKEVLEKRF